ncbi:MAG: hypothetical protein H0T10_00150, partial [Actinobacteria bacterium]|nr:hypothetical protein [Actinomycetota bacterium]
DSGELAAVVQSVCAATGELLLSADDVRESGADLFDPFNGKVPAVVPGLDLTVFAPGQPVLISFGLAEDADPSTTGPKLPTSITAISNDRGVAGADE